MCFGTRDDMYGSFTIKQAGSIGALKLVHLYGILLCNMRWSRELTLWGCPSPVYGNKTLMTVISYPKQLSVLLPRQNSTQMGDPGFCARELSYKLNGFNDTSPEIIFNTSLEPLSVSLGQEYWIWYGQDMANCSENNNDGQSCVDVYGWYKL